MANKTNVKRNLTIVELALAGQTVREIADQVGLTYPRISQILNDKEYKDLLEQGHKRQILSLHHAIDKHDTLIDSEDEKVALGAVQLRYKTIGILPSHTQATYIQTLNIQSNIVIDAATSKAIDDMLEYKRSLLPSTVSPPTDTNVIDVDGVVVSEDRED